MAHGHHEVLAKGYVERVEIVCRGEMIASHARSYDAHDFIYNLHSCAPRGRVKRPAWLPSWSHDFRFHLAQVGQVGEGRILPLDVKLSKWP